jgi:hypothetical protein
LCEGSLVTSGRAYWYKGTGAKTGKVKELKYWIPSSVTLDAEKAKQNIIMFRRQGVSELFPAESVLYTWGIDSDVELGPPTLWPLASAMVAAQANGAINKWVADYMARGAIKAMLLMVDGMPPAGEVERVENWFNRFMSGAKGLAWKVFNGEAVKPTIIGDGLEALRDLSITQDLRREIHTALGTRHLLEDENFATALARERQFYTITIMPDARLIQGSLNDQIFHAVGYHMEFEPERLEVFQEDEGVQAQAFLTLFQGFKEVMAVDAAFQLASEKLDYTFSDEQMAMIQKGIADKNKPAEVTPVPVPDVVPPEVVKALVELDKWEAKVKAAGKMCVWHAVSLSPEIVKAVREGLPFEQARAMVSVKKDDSIKALADAIERAVNEK